VNDTPEKKSHPVDVHVGARVQQKRKSLGLSQTKLGKAVGLTFQQIQKYESGANRISASKLWEISQTLSTPLMFFFEGLQDPVEEANDETVRRFLESDEGLLVAKSITGLSPKMRIRVIEFIDGMADDTDEASAQ
jgi:transcriptional regulator with XRE-family HTH domain